MTTENTEMEELEAVLSEQMDKLEETPEQITEEQPEIEQEQPETEAQEVTEPVEQTEQAEVEETAADVEDIAPSSWKKDVSEKWADLPAEVKAEINRREADYHKGIEQYKHQYEAMQPVANVIQQNQDLMQAAGVNPEVAISHLMNAHRVLTYGSQEQKQQAIAQIARDSGIDLSKVVPAAPIDPQVQQLMAQNRQLQQFQQQTIAQQQNAVQSQIQAFAQQPEHEHFEAVKSDMAIMLQNGMAQDLKEAYDKAVWARPDLRQSLVQKQRTEAETRATMQAQKQRAKSAAVGVKGSSPSSTGAIPDSASLEDTIAAAVDGLI